jgi:tRNA1(Val) A37 N6-methylase TrmN6
MTVLKTHSVKNLEENGVAIDYLFNAFDTGKVNSKTELFNTKVFKNKYKLNPNNVFKEPSFEDSNEVITHDNLVSKTRIFPLMNVFPPTNRVLYKHIFNKMQEKQSLLRTKKNFLDIGCGSGILPVIFRKAVMTAKTQFFALDKTTSALESTKLNANLFEMSVNTQLVDITNDTNYERKLFAQGPDTFDFIISNPPWMVARPLEDFDTGNYDFEETFLKKLFQIVVAYLDKDRGTFWLVYSDLSETLGLQKKSRIQELCDSRGLVVKNVYACPTEEASKSPRTNLDVIKRQTSYLIYEITF